MTNCRFCGAENLVWKNENDKWQLYTDSGEKHVCGEDEGVPIFWRGKNGVFYAHTDEVIAKMITELCIKKGWDPYTTRFKRVGRGYFARLVRCR